MLSLTRRELRRFFSQPLGWMLCAGYLAAQAAFFVVYLHSHLSPVPQTVPPTRMIYSGGYMLLVDLLFFPALALRAFAEERWRGTWDTLASSGTGFARIVAGKFFFGLSVVVFWRILFCSLALFILPFTRVDPGMLFSSFIALTLGGAFWLAVCLLASARSKTLIGGWVAGSAALSGLWLFPFLKLAFPDPLYNALFEVADFNGIYSRASRGLLFAQDLVFLSAGCLIALALTLILLDRERGGQDKSLRRAAASAVLSVGFALLFYLVMYIAYAGQYRVNLASEGREKLSETYEQVLNSLPEPPKITVVLPAASSAACYAEARERILELARETAEATGATLDSLDPDLQIAEYARLRQRHDFDKNRLGGVIVSIKGREQALPYHAFVGLDTVTVDSQGKQYIKSFYGERLFASAFLSLLRLDKKNRILVLGGHGELDLREEINRPVLDLISDLGFFPYLIRSGIEDIPDLSDTAAVLWISPKTAPNPEGSRLLNRVFEQKVPLFAAVGGDSPLGGGVGDFISRYGVDLLDVSLRQHKNPSQDPKLFVTGRFSKHPPYARLIEQSCTLYNIRPLEKGIPSDPRIETYPLIRIDESHQATLAGNADDAAFVQPPYEVAFAANWKLDNREQPALVVLGSAAPFQPEFFHDGANSELIARALNWLAFPHEHSMIPPARLLNYRMNLNERAIRLLQFLSLALIPALLLGIAWTVHLRRR